MEFRHENRGLEIVNDRPVDTAKPRGFGSEEL